MFDADRANARSYLRRAGLTLAAAALLAGCSSMDPTGLLDSETAEPEQVDDSQAQDAASPKVSDVPDEPKHTPSSRDARKGMQERLAADNRNARYSDETLRAPEAAPEQPEATPERPESARAQRTSGRDAERSQGSGPDAQTAQSQAGAAAEATARTENGDDAATGNGDSASRRASEPRDAPETPEGDGAAEMPEVPPAPSEADEAERAAADARDTRAGRNVGRDTGAEPSRSQTATRPERDSASGNSASDTAASGRSASGGASQTGTADAPAEPDPASAMPRPSGTQAQDGGQRTTAAADSGNPSRPQPSAPQPARAPEPENGAAADSQAVQVNRSQIPQMKPSRRGEPVQLPTQIRQRVGAGGTNAGDAGAQRRRNSRQQSARLRTPPSSPSRVEPQANTDGAGQQLAVIYFGHATAGLNGEDRQVLEKVAELHDQQGGGLRVVGHASSRTATMDMIQHRMVNLDISMKRAENVADALVTYGVPRGEITVEARADRDLAYHEFMPTGEAGNRRAEIFLTN